MSDIPYQFEARRFFAAALAKAITEIKDVEKNARNEHHRYRYANAEAIYGEVRTVLANNGLSVIPKSMLIDLNSQKEVDFKDGKDKFVLRMPTCKMARIFILQHAGGHYEELVLEWPFTEDKGRPIEKAVAASDTSSLKYLLRDLMILPAVDEEVDTKAPSSGVNQTGGTQAAPKTTQAPKTETKTAPTTTPAPTKSADPKPNVTTSAGTGTVTTKPTDATPTNSDANAAMKKEFDEALQRTEASAKGEAPKTDPKPAEAPKTTVTTAAPTTDAFKIRQGEVGKSLTLLMDMYTKKGVAEAAVKEAWNKRAGSVFIEDKIKRSLMTETVVANMREDIVLNDKNEPVSSKVIEALVPAGVAA